MLVSNRKSKPRPEWALPKHVHKAPEKDFVKPSILSMAATELLYGIYDTDEPK